MNTIGKMVTGLGALLSVILVLTACDKYNYIDKLQSLGHRVEILEKMVLEANNSINALNDLIIAIEQRGYITAVDENEDGTYTITFKKVVDGDTVYTTYTLRDGRIGTDGTDGQDAQLNMSVAEDPADGNWYWMLNGQWLLDDNGNKVRAGALDGSDGTDGKSAAEANIYVPQVRINASTRNWEISTDGGRSWTDTGFCADGKDGQNGKDGQDGNDDLVLTIIPSDDGLSITIYLYGRFYTVPIISN